MTNWHFVLRSGIIIPAEIRPEDLEIIRNAVLDALETARGIRIDFNDGKGGFVMSDEIAAFVPYDTLGVG
jgi:hypothetical protein